MSKLPSLNTAKISHELSGSGSLSPAHQLVRSLPEEYASWVLSTWLHKLYSMQVTQTKLLAKLPLIKQCNQILQNLKKCSTFEEAQGIVFMQQPQQQQQQPSFVQAMVAILSLLPKDPLLKEKNSMIIFTRKVITALLIAYYPTEILAPSYGNGSGLASSEMQMIVKQTAIAAKLVSRYCEKLFVYCLTASSAAHTGSIPIPSRDSFSRLLSSFHLTIRWFFSAFQSWKVLDAQQVKESLSETLAISYENFLQAKLASILHSQHGQGQLLAQSDSSQQAGEIERVLTAASIQVEKIKEVMKQMLGNGPAAPSSTMMAAQQLIDEIMRKVQRQFAEDYGEEVLASLLDEGGAGGRATMSIAAGSQMRSNLPTTTAALPAASVVVAANTSAVSKTELPPPTYSHSIGPEPPPPLPTAIQQALSSQQSAQTVQSAQQVQQMKYLQLLSQLAGIENERLAYEITLDPQYRLPPSSGSGRADSDPDQGDQLQGGQAGLAAFLKQKMLTVLADKMINSLRPSNISQQEMMMTMGIKEGMVLPIKVSLTPRLPSWLAPSGSRQQAQLQSKQLKQQQQKQLKEGEYYLLSAKVLKVYTIQHKAATIVDAADDSEDEEAEIETSYVMDLLYLAESTPSSPSIEQAVPYHRIYTLQEASHGQLMIQTLKDLAASLAAFTPHRPDIHREMVELLFGGVEQEKVLLSLLAGQLVSAVNSGSNSSSSKLHAGEAAGDADKVVVTAKADQLPQLADKADQQQAVAVTGGSAIAFTAATTAVATSAVTMTMQRRVCYLDPMKDILPIFITLYTAAMNMQAEYRWVYAKAWWKDYLAVFVPLATTAGQQPATEAITAAAAANNRVWEAVQQRYIPLIPSSSSSGSSGSVSQGGWQAVIPLVPIFLERITEITEEMEYDMANYYISLLVPTLQQHGIAYLSQRFRERCNLGMISLEYTQRWLRSVYVRNNNLIETMNLLKEVEYPPAIAIIDTAALMRQQVFLASITLPSAPSSTIDGQQQQQQQPQQSLPVLLPGILGVGFIRILQQQQFALPSSSSTMQLPETFSWDIARLVTLRNLIDTIAIECTLVLTTRQLIGHYLTQQAQQAQTQQGQQAAQANKEAAAVLLANREAEEMRLQYRLDVLLKDAIVGDNNGVNYASIIAELVQYVQSTLVQAIPGHSQRMVAKGTPGYDLHTFHRGIEEAGTAVAGDDVAAKDSSSSNNSSNVSVTYDTKDLYTRVEKAVKDILSLPSSSSSSASSAVSSTAVTATSLPLPPPPHPILQLFQKRILHILLRACLQLPYAQKLPAFSLASAAQEKNLLQLVTLGHRLFQHTIGVHGMVYREMIQKMYEEEEGIRIV